MSTADNNDSAERTATLSRMVDMRIPLWGVLCALGSGVVLAVTLWLTTQQLVATVNELKITVTSGNTSVSVMTSEIALIKFRLSIVEENAKMQAQGKGRS